MDHDRRSAAPAGTIPRQPNPEPDLPATPPGESDPADEPGEGDPEDERRPGRTPPPLRD